MSNYNIINGDCLEVMREIPSSIFDLVITSPPYNLGEGMEDKGGFRVGHKGSKWSSTTFNKGYNSYADNLPYPQYVKWQQEVLKECWRLLTPAGAIFYNHKPRIVKGSLRLPTVLIGDLPLRQVIIWDRMSGMNYMSGAYMPMCEWILLIAKPDFKLRDKSASGIGDVWSFPPDSGNEHEAPFPPELPHRILETTTAKKVLDPFAGSSTTGVVCAEFGCDYVGIEIDPFYCEYGESRIKRAIGKPCDIPQRITNEKDLPLFL